MKRLLALLAAAVMIGVAFIIRSQGGEDVSPDQAEPAPSTAAPVETNLSVACIEEAVSACRAAGLQSTVSFDVVFDQLTTEAEPVVDVWVVADPWPDIIDAQRSRNGLDPIMGSSVEVASTWLRSFGWSDLASACSPTCDLESEGVGQSIGVRDPSRSATGPMALAAIAAQLDANPSDAIGSASAAESAVALRSLNIKAQTGSYDSPLDAMTLVGQGAFSVTVDLESEATAVLAGSRIENDIADVLAIRTPDRVALRVVAVGDRASGDDLTSLSSALRPELERLGWTSDADGSPPDAASVLEFRTLWEEIAR